MAHVARGPGRPSSSEGPGGREVLLQAARELLAERGLPRVTVRAVAERAGVKPALVNYHFGGKQGLLRAVTLRVGFELRERMAGALASAGAAPDRLRQLVESVIGSLAQDPNAARLLVEQLLFAEGETLDEIVEQVARPNLALVRGLLADGRREGTLRDVDPADLMPLLVGTSLFFFLSQPIAQRLFPEREFCAERCQAFARQAADLLLHGLCAPEGMPT